MHIKSLPVQAAIVLVVIGLSALIISIWIRWAFALDKLLTVGLFATLAGLALAGAAFLQGTICEKRSEIDKLV